MWTITISPTLESQETTHRLRLEVLLTDYKNAHPTAHAGLEILFEVTVTAAVCDCSLLTWDAPVSNQVEIATVKSIPDHSFYITQATVNTASKTASAPIRACGGTCSETGTVTAIVDIETGLQPTWLTLNTGQVTVHSTANTDANLYKMRVTMSTPNSGDQTIETVRINLGLCVITHLTAPSDVTTLDRHHEVFALVNLMIDLQDASLASPGFQQVPACGYYLVETFTWTIPAVQNADGGTAIQQYTDPVTNVVENYKLLVTTNTPGHAAVYSVTLTLNAVYATDPIH